MLWAVGYWPQDWHSAQALGRWQPWLPPPTDAHGVWQGVYWVYRLPVFIAYAAFVITTLFWPTPKNLAHVLALSAAVLIGIQFWYADNGGVYVLWHLPFLLLLVFRPNLTDRPAAADARRLAEAAWPAVRGAVSAAVPTAEACAGGVK